MRHRPSRDDIRFRAVFEALTLSPAEFDHPGHLRLAYVYLCEHDVDGAVTAMRDALVAFLAARGIPASKYHATITRAWIMAVAHFMRQSPPCASAAALLRRRPELLDTTIMLTHYSPARLFSGRARRAFLAPDRQPIPFS